jgi:SMC interacting uncharacterized protein involved in chromosome segregation
MPLPENLIEGLPREAVNELAILEDRALRAEGQLSNSVRRMGEMEDEIAKLRSEVEMMLGLCHELEEFTERMSEAAHSEAAKVEQALRRFLVVQAG